MGNRGLPSEPCERAVATKAPGYSVRSISLGTGPGTLRSSQAIAGPEMIEVVIAMMTSATNIFSLIIFASSAMAAVPASVKTLGDYVQWCKANPDKASYGTTSAGATPHFAGVMLANEAMWT